MGCRSAIVCLGRPLVDGTAPRRPLVHAHERQCVLRVFPCPRENVRLYLDSLVVAYESPSLHPAWVGCHGDLGRYLKGGYSWAESKMAVSLSQVLLHLTPARGRC